jgi:hypothetical protein
MSTKAYYNNYYLEHKEKYKKYYQTHKKERAEYVKQYLINHKDDKEWQEKMSKRTKQYYKKNTQKILKYLMKYYDENTDKCKEKGLAWQGEHIEERKSYINNYRFKSEIQKRIKVLSKSQRLLLNGIICKKPCKCGSEHKLKMYHLDYVNPMNIEWKCNECFWKATKERNRLNKELTST